MRVLVALAVFWLPWAAWRLHLAGKRMDELIASALVSEPPCHVQLVPGPRPPADSVREVG